MPALESQGQRQVELSKFKASLIYYNRTLGDNQGYL